MDPKGKESTIKKLNDALQLLEPNPSKKPNADDMEQSNEEYVTLKKTDLELAKSNIKSVRTDVSMIQETKPNQGGDNSKKKAQLYIPIKTERARDFENTITHFLKDIRLKVFYKNTDLKPNIPLLVLCQVVSRWESDISATLKDFQWPKRYVTLVVFLERENKLPHIPTEVHLDPTTLPYGDVKFIDAAFTIEEKFYKCNMNSEAQQKIKEFVANFNKK